MDTQPEIRVLTADQRAELKRVTLLAKQNEPDFWYGPDDMPHNVIRQDMPYIAAVRPDLTLGTLAYVEQLEGQLSELRGKVTSMLEDFANGCVPVQMAPGVSLTPYWRGVNTERGNGLQWAELKCKELGIEWPIKSIPYQSNLPAPAPSPSTGSPAADWTSKPCTCGFLAQTVGDGCPKCNPECYQEEGEEAGSPAPEGEPIGTYEDGAPVYATDDYTQIGGLFVRRSDYNKFRDWQKAQQQPAAPTLVETGKEENQNG